ncbi:MAG: sensor histidine kinase [Actinomycetota bacterium]
MSTGEQLEEDWVRGAQEDPQRYRRTLAGGILVFRWVWLVWMVALAISASDDFRLPGLAWASIGAAAAWTAWLTATRHRWTTPALWFDLVLCVWLVLGSGLVVEDRGVISGRPFFATGYPLSAPLFWGASRGVRGGLFAGAILGIAHVASRPLNAVGIGELSATQFQNMLGAVLNYIVAGVAIGIVSRVLVRSAEAVAAASQRLIRERERAARLAEREKLARHIHDSVLQSLAFVHKKGRELAERDPIPAAEVSELAQLAGRQETELRSLILRDPEPGPMGRASLREALEMTAREVTDVDVTVSSVGPIWLDAASVEEIAAAVRQALGNVARHAQAHSATVFAEVEGGQVVVTVRDDGVGFDYDEGRLRAEGKAGMLKSMKGRVEDLGGRMLVTSAPGKGAEIEFHIPEDRAT